MKNSRYLLPLFLAVMASCSSKENSENPASKSVEISYELDTVMIDAGEEFIHVNWQMMSSDLSKDGKYLYNFKTGAEKPGVEIINLEELKLKQVIPMSLDGPNNIRHPYISSVDVLDDDTFYLSDSYFLYRFDQEGTKLSTLNLADHNFEGEKLPDDLRIDLNQTLSEDGNSLITFYADKFLEKAPMGIAVFDFQKESFYYKPVDVLKSLEKYRVNFYFNDNPAGAMFSSFYLLSKNDTLIFSNGGVNQLYFYNLKTDSISHKTYSSEFTSYEITSSYPSRMDDEVAYRELTKETQKEVNYGRLYYDKVHQVYWRFTKEFNKMKGETPLFKTVLTVFDPQFDQLGEILLQEDFVLPYKVFVKNGAIWTFLNIEDEVAFVRLKPTINYE
ncbi:DUF4221 domain-containing protein [Algoriphagus machipongonensis]|uniref:Lipoprotein n=1 Tax=Algoriphagus machipongonensis TaxID=388413 RepID=A3HUC2_9BACT|nr:DUF4221 domain-containing protein [Algoriphagus machipongonensis]EAZ81744.1 hypothetical protein ALPR1_00845 [Algoriphagus machipongonensis]